jgi:general secretion pathway protein C
MQDLVKRYFWVVSVIAVIACAYFAASATGSVVEAKLLGDPAEAPKIPPPPVAEVAKPTTPVRSKAGAPVADRNMFCSDCKPPEVAAVSPTTPVAPGTVVPTALHLVLIATSVGTDPRYSFATILNTDTDKQGGYFVADVIPDAGPIKEIHFKYVDFQNTALNRTERVGLFGETPPPPPPPVAVAVADKPPGDPDDEMAAAVAAGIKKIDESNYEIDRNLVDKVLANPMAVAKGARVVPSVKDGKANGFKLYAIRPSSVYAQIGLANGDTIHAINGFDLTSPDKALEVYTKVKEATALQVQVTRRGKEMTINYAIK